MGKHQSPMVELNDETVGFEASGKDDAVRLEANLPTVDECFVELVSFLTDGGLSEEDAFAVIGKGFSSIDFTEENIHYPAGSREI